ncbi:protein D1-like [Phymastichus coffea]|uniref:protein D1-like n=1 Tax=Phymastichus coffea TaxID=108790 RepID=UPI00273C8270|nr:protein D1-like [Phymastichus coffea]
MFITKVKMKLALGDIVIALLLYWLSIIAADLTTDFTQSEVVPDGISQSPNELLTVKYNDKSIQFNEEWTPTNIKNQPKVEWNADPSSYYAIIMTDLDAPKRSRPAYREMLHWLVTNIPGNDISQAYTIAEYVPSGPQIHTGKHRILYTLYKQPGKLDFDEPKSHNRSLIMRLRFSQKNFSHKYNLGDPISANVILVEYDDYVPILHKEILRVHSD